MTQAINSAGEVSVRRSNSLTLPSDMYKRVDFYLTTNSGKAATLFLLKWAWRLDKS